MCTRMLACVSVYVCVCALVFVCVLLCATACVLCEGGAGQGNILKNNFDFRYLSKFSEMYRLKNFYVYACFVLTRNLDKHEIIYISNKDSYIKKKFEVEVVQIQ